MKILIIGGVGYIGSSLYEALSAGYQVDTVDLEWFGNYVNKKNLREDFSKIPRFFYLNYDIIILLAGHASVRMCENNLLGAFNNNVRNFVNLIPFLEDKKFIYASSSSVYGNIDLKQADEDCLTYKPNNFYDLTKSEIDNYAKLFKGLNFYGLRFGTVNGFSRNLRTDIMINSMVNTAKEQKIIKVANPGISRPILGMRDLVDSILKIVFSKENHPGVYNLASFNSTVDQIANQVSSILNIPIQYQDLPAYTIADNKLHSRTYDFSINCQKFTSIYDFTFKCTVESVVEELLTSWGDMAKGARNSTVHYY